MYSMLTFLIVGTLWTVNCGIHSFQYIATAFSKPVNLPGIHEFTALGLLDDSRVIGRYDSSLRKAVPKQPWMERLGKDFWDSQTQLAMGEEAHCRAGWRSSNDTGLHIVQERLGCTAEKQANKSLKFISYLNDHSLDGEFFMSFDFVNKCMIIHHGDLAVPTKRCMAPDDPNDYYNYWHYYLEKECVDWLSKYLDYEQDHLKNIQPPDLHVYGKKNKNPSFITLHCMATGFLFKAVTLNIRRDGKLVDQLDGLQTTGVRPNGDDTYQIMNQVEILRSDSARYTCEVIHPASNMHKIKDWEPMNETTTSSSDPAQGSSSGEFTQPETIVLLKEDVA